MVLVGGSTTCYVINHDYEPLSKVRMSEDKCFWQKKQNMYVCMYVGVYVFGYEAVIRMF